MTYYIVQMQRVDRSWFEITAGPPRTLTEAKRIARRRLVKNLNSDNLALRKLDVRIIKRTDEVVEGWKQ